MKTKVGSKKTSSKELSQYFAAQISVAKKRNRVSSALLRISHLRCVLWSAGRDARGLSESPLGALDCWEWFSKQTKWVESEENWDWVGLLSNNRHYDIGYMEAIGIRGRLRKRECPSDNKENDVGKEKSAGIKEMCCLATSGKKKTRRDIT